jgi:hypothetical protein
LFSVCWPATEVEFKLLPPARESLTSPNELSALCNLLYAISLVGCENYKEMEDIEARMAALESAAAEAK